MTNVQLIVFDMAGTTVKDDGFVANAFVNAFKKNGFVISQNDSHPFMGVKKIIAVKQMLEKLGKGADKAMVEKIHEDFVKEMVDFYKTDERICPMKDAEQVFAMLKEKGIIITLDTGFPKVIAEAIVKRFQWEEKGLIDDYIGSDEVEQGRPHPFMIRELMRRNGVLDAKNVAKVGDTVVDIEEGINAECGYVIGVTTGTGDKDELNSEKPTHIVNSLTDLLSIF